MLLALLFFIPLAIYWPGLFGDFFLDDFPHIVNNPVVQVNELTFNTLWAAANSTHSGPLGRPLALVSFALNYYYTGLDPFYFKLTNLLIHAMTGIGIYLLAYRVVSRMRPTPSARNIAFFTALLWLVHPLNVSTVLYAVQRMTGLATLLIVWGMVMYCHGREYLLSKHMGRGLTWITGGLLLGGVGLFCKETAILMLGYLAVVEYFAFHFDMPTTRQRRMLQAAYGLIIGVPLTWALATNLLAPGWTEIAYASRAFTFQERVLTETRVLWDYLYLTWLPNIQAMGLYYDGYKISQGFLEPPSTLLAVAGHVIMLCTMVMARKRWPLLAFATAWFYAGHSIESTVLPLEIKYEHRNYLAMLGMLLLLVYCIYTASTWFKNTRKIRITTIAAIVLTFTGGTLVRASQFGDFWGFSSVEADHHPESARANHNAAVSALRLMMLTQKAPPELIDKTIAYLYRSAKADPNTTAPLFTAVLFLPELAHTAPPRYFKEELASRLRNGFTDANINTMFNVLLRQAQDGKLQLSSNEVHSLCRQAENNPRIPDGIKSEVLANEAVYTASIDKNPVQAKLIIDRALRMDSTRAGIYVPAIWIYRKAGLWQDAEAMLDQFRKLDVYGVNRSSIELLESTSEKPAPQ